MSLNDPFLSRPSCPLLIFTMSRGGHITDLRKGLRRMLTRYYPQEVCTRMAACATMNYWQSGNRKERCIMVTADGSPWVEAMLMMLYAHLSHRQCKLRTPMAEYTVSYDGMDDTDRMVALANHYLWLGEFFERHIGNKGERHSLN